MEKGSWDSLLSQVWWYC